jgi:hypothetical protein
MNILDIVNIVPSSGPGVLSYIEVALDYTSLFHGKEWIDAAGTRTPFYNAQPAGASLLPATTLQIVQNSRYAGTWTVYTPTSAADPNVPVAFVGGNTRIYLRDTMPAGTGAELTDGLIQNISTYLVPIVGGSPKLVLERQVYTDRPINLFGREAVMWGEGMQDNLLMVTQNFAGPSAPANPFQGQFWYNTSSGLMMVWTGSPLNTWQIVNASSLSVSYRHTQTISSTTWQVNHNLNLASPYIAEHAFFINTSGGVKPVAPLDVTYVNANRFDVSFASAETGYVITRK